MALVQNQFEPADSRLRESLAGLEKLGEIYQVARTQLALARLARGRRQTAAAEAYLAACEPVFARLEAASDLAAVRALRGELSASPEPSPL